MLSFPYRPTLTSIRPHHWKDINSNSLARYWRFPYHRPSVWLLAFAHMLLTHFVHPPITPPESSHHIVFLCCSLSWKGLSNSSLITDFICNFIVDHRCQYFCEVFSYCISLSVLLWARNSVCVYVSPSFYLICLHEVLPAWTELQATILFSQFRIQKRHWINIHWLDQVYLFEIPKWILLFQSVETYTWVSCSAKFLVVFYSNQSPFESQILLHAHIQYKV